MLPTSIPVLCFLLFFISFSQAQEESYEYSHDSKIQEGVPQGNITKHVWQSSFYNKNFREYYLYIPQQYKPNEPAALMVFQDGHAYVKEDGAFRVPLVFDNLIHKGDMPITIGLFVNPGHHSEDFPENRFRSSNRSWEYDD